MGDTFDAERTGSAGTDIETHFTIVAVISLIFSIPVLLLGAFIFFGSIVGAGFADAFSNVPFLGALIAGAGFVIGLLIAALGIPGTIAGIGLLQRRAWAKIWTFIVAALNLVNFPIGTAFGVYAIWVMTRPEADRALE